MQSDLPRQGASVTGRISLHNYRGMSSGALISEREIFTFLFLGDNIYACKKQIKRKEGKIIL